MLQLPTGAHENLLECDTGVQGVRIGLASIRKAKHGFHAPRAIGLFENGVIRSTPAPELIYTMADPPNTRVA
jgi:hypothetical protein